MAISMAAYNTIRQIVDERIDTFKEQMEEIKIERIDFGELKGQVSKLTISVDKLAEAQTRTEQSIERLDESVDKLAQAQTEMKQAMKQLAINIGGLSDTIGFGLEDIARIVVPGYLERHEDIYIRGVAKRFCRN